VAAEAAEYALAIVKETVFFVEKAMEAIREAAAAAAKNALCAVGKSNSEFL
jgi:hypothetical protein